MRCSCVAAIGAVIAVSVSACGRDTGEESVGSTSAKLVAWANGDFSQVLRVNANQITVNNTCRLDIPLSSQVKPMTFIASSTFTGMTSLAWKGSAVTNGILSVNGCPSYPCNVVASFRGLGFGGGILDCSVIADDGTSRLIGTSTGNALSVLVPPTASVQFSHSVKIGAPNGHISGSCILRQNASLPAASVSNFTVSVNGNPRVTGLDPILIGEVDWPSPGPSVDFGRLLMGTEIGSTRLRHVAPRNEQLVEGDALSCGGSFLDGLVPVFEVNPGVPTGMGVSLVRGGTGWTCGAATFGTGTGCNLGCGIPDPDCSCLTHTDCSEGTYCDAAGACVPKKANGQPCDSHSECSSNACVNDICCSFGEGFIRVELLTGSLNPSSVAIGDFNKDGSGDLVVAASGSNNVIQFLNNGAGNFLAPTSYGVGLKPSSIAIGDFNVDTDSDLVVANRGSNTISALLGTEPGGSFSAQTQFPAGTGPASIATGDFNNDSVLDVAVANFDGDNLSVLLGTGLGTFLAPDTYGTGDGPASVVTANFNGDNHLDIAVTNVGDPTSFPLPAGTVSVRLGTGGGAFSPPTTIATGGLLPFSVTAGDFNGDVVPDLAVANYGDPLGFSANSTVSVLLGTGAGTFLSPQTYSLLTGLPGAQAIAVVDFNKDGERDLVVASATNDISILLGTGTGTFSVLQPMTFTGLNNNGSVAVGDFNGDTGEDVVVTNFGTEEAPGSGADNSITVLYNQCQ